MNERTSSTFLCVVDLTLFKAGVFFFFFLLFPEIKGLLDGGLGQLVVTGDPKQFGPIVKSPVASRLGMGKSTHRDAVLCHVYGAVIGQTRLHIHACRSVPAGALDERLSPLPEDRRRVQQALYHQAAAQLQVRFQKCPSTTHLQSSNHCERLCLPLFSGPTQPS